MKKIVHLCVLVLFISGLMVSCVSKKKYQTAQAHIAALQTDSARFEAKIAELEMKVKELESDLAITRQNYEELKDATANEIASLMVQLQQQGQKLNEKDEALRERAARLQALQERLNKQQVIVDRLRKTVEDALVGFDQDELSVEVKNGKVYVSLSDKLLFPSGSAQLNDEGKQAIGKVAKVLEQNPKINIDVVGHTDSIPINTAKYSDNWDLSTGRATTITRLLTKEHNIPGSRLTASGMSKYQPVASNETKEGRAKNRRTEIILTPKLEELFKILDGSSVSTD